MSTPAFDSIITTGERIADDGNKSQALNFIISSRSSRNDLTIRDQMNYFAFVSSVYRRDFKDYERYMAVADSMIAMLDKYGHINYFSNKFYVTAYSMKADGLFALGDYNESYDYYFKAKSLAQKFGDSCALSNYAYSLGMVLYRQQRFVEAAHNFHEAIDVADGCEKNFPFFYRKQEVLDNIGLSYKGAGMYDSALYYYNSTLSYIDANYLRYPKKENLYITAKAVVYGNLGDLYISHKKYDTAIELLKKSIDINLQKGYTNDDAILTQVKLANLYYNIGNPDQMKETLVNIEAELDTIPNSNVALSLKKLWWNYYDIKKDSIKAHRYLNAYVVQNDSFIALNNNLMATDLSGRIKSMERINHINLLKKDNEQEKLYLVIAVLIALLALTIVGIVLRNSFRSRKNVAALKELNNKVNIQNERLATALEELEQKDKDKSRILRSVAHDVMNPIAAIMSLADILSEESEGFSADQKEMLELIKEACNNSLSLSRDILQASVKIDPATVEKEKVNINELVANCVKLLSVQAATKKQELILVSHNEDVQILVNSKTIWRVINNLVGNAIKFSYENSTIEIHIVTVLDKVHISVVDNGVGIPEKNKAHVFDMFTEVKIPGTSGEIPHGLGLSISLQIARAHKGDIWFESEVGKGTTFHLSLPINLHT